MFPYISFSRKGRDTIVPLPKALRHLDARTLADIGVEEGLVHRDLLDTASRNLLRVVGVSLNDGR